MRAPLPHGRGSENACHETHKTKVDDALVMPELPEAETIARGLRRAVRGQKLRTTHLTRPEMVHGVDCTLSTALRNRKVMDVIRRGKRVIIRLDKGASLVFALGMTGSITVERASEACDRHTHLRISFGDRSREIRFRDPRRFGVIWFLDNSTATSGRQLSPLGDEPLEINITRFRALLTRKRQIKAFLLDQRLIAGLGNIYCDEALHRAGIHPTIRADDLTPKQSLALLRRIRSVLRSAIKCGGSTFMDYRNADGRPGGFQRKHRVYQREGQPCYRCNTQIQRIAAAGRSTHFCPTCQPHVGTA